MTTPSHPGTPAPAARQDSLIEYPSLFPIKVMGQKADGFVQAMTHIAHNL